MSAKRGNPYKIKGRFANSKGKNRWSYESRRNQASGKF
jgi:hypothetical protein